MIWGLCLVVEIIILSRINIYVNTYGIFFANNRKV